MKIELKNVKYAAFASQETSCFSATIYVDGKKAGTAENSGHGGATIVRPDDLSRRINAYAKTLPTIKTDMPDPHEEGKKFEYAQSDETLIDDLLNTYLAERDMVRLMSKRVLFTKPGQKGVFQTKAVPAATMSEWLGNPAAAAAMGADKILNLLPRAEALNIFRSAAQ